MITLVFDTETTGLPARNEVVSSPSYPHLVQIAGLLLDDERELSSFDFIVKPDGWMIPVEAVAVHGISDETANRIGVPLRLAVAAYTNLYRVADEVAGHNVEFDLGIIGAAMYRCGYNHALLPPRALACTVALGTDAVRLPPTEKMIAAGYGGQFKRPNLTELYRFLFGESFDGAHSALADCRAAARCLTELRKRETE